MTRYITIGATVVTANSSEFKRIRGLKVENWPRLKLISAFRTLGMRPA